MATSSPSSRKPLAYYMRAIHRYLGFFAVGIMVVYALSGITLLYRTGSFLKTSTPVEAVVDPGLDADGLAAAIKVRSIKPITATDSIITFADGSYDRITGKVSYTRTQIVEPVQSFISFHKVSEAKSPVLAYAATAFGIILILLALTSLFMYRPSAKPFVTNMVLFALGLAAAIALVLLS